MLALAVVASSCAGDDTHKPEARPCPSPTPIEDRAILPADLMLERFATVTDAEVKKGFLGAEAIATTSVVEVYPPLARQLVDAGYDILSSDNEGFEAEIFFARGKRTTGTYLLREGPCKGQVTIRLLYGSKRYRG